MAWQEAYNEERAGYVKQLDDKGDEPRSGLLEDIRTTPLFSLLAKYSTEHQDTDHKSTSLLPNYRLLGFNIGTTDGIAPKEPILQNVAAPNSTFICGSQGSGKSYTLSVMLENCVLPNKVGRKLQKPIPGLVFHYDSDSSGSRAEAAYLCSRGIKTRVLLSKSNLKTLGSKYEALPGAKQNLQVQPLELHPKHLTVERMLKLMSFTDQSGKVPLYMVTLQGILRAMAEESNGASFNYEEFKRRVDTQEFTKDQLGPLALRLDILESFMVKMKAENSKQARRELRDRMANAERLFDLEPGTLTIIDLSDPFVEAATACILFDICFGIAKAVTVQREESLVVALDEAHKFMNQSAAAETFTDRMLTTIREQRHKGIRIIIATQEPTISPKLLDLSSVTVVHFFKSPDWFDTIKKHLSGASDNTNSKEEQHDVFKQILNLQVGESLVFAPSSFLCYEDSAQKLGSNIMKMKTRKREGEDGGKSVLAGGIAGSSGNRDRGNDSDDEEDENEDEYDLPPGMKAMQVRK